MRGRIKTGFTLVELLAVIVLFALLASLILPVIAGHYNRLRRRTPCKSNLSQIGKACGMYAEIPAHMGRLPDYGDGNPMSALNLLYDSYIDDPRVFSCPFAPFSVKVLNKATAPGFTPNLGDRESSPGSSYGYDIGHLDTHGVAGIAADAGNGRDASKKSNSRNHNGNGQYLLLGAGSVEWLERGIRDLGEDSPRDCIWVDDLDVEDDEDSAISQRAREPP